MPAARQIADALAAEISAGTLAPGERLPSETTLVQRFGVAKQTARAAVALLRRDGLAYSLPGRGSFVTNPADRETVTVPAGAMVTARNATDSERREGRDSPVLVVELDGQTMEYRADRTVITFQP